MAMPVYAHVGKHVYAHQAACEITGDDRPVATSVLADMVIIASTST